MLKSTQTKISVGAVWAQSPDRILAVNGHIPWQVTADLRFFAELTRGSTVLMGRHTWESLPSAPLPRRTNLVLTRNPNFSAEGAIVCHTWHQALEHAQELQKDLWIIGGASIYEQALPYCEKLVISTIDYQLPDAEATADLTLAPQINPQAWAKDETPSDSAWRQASCGKKWRVDYYQRQPDSAL